MNIRLRLKEIILIILLKVYFPKIVIRILNTSEDFQKVYDLLWQAYGAEEKYIDVNIVGSSPRIFEDKYEKHSITIGAFDGNILAGTLRMIFSSPLGFYAQEDFNIDLSSFLESELIEISRIAVSKQYRTKSLIVFGLVRKALEISKKRGGKYWIIVTFEKIKNHFSEFFGIQFYPLEMGELTEKQIECRKKMSHYYENNPAPYIIRIHEVY